VGSLLALLAYPLVVEPNLRLAQQCTAWTAGYGLFVALTLGCATIVWRSQKPASALPTISSPTPRPDRLRAGQVLHWVFLAFIPSSLMLGVTTYLTTDIAAIPLLWVIPLAIYLLTFILSFARRPVLHHSWMIRAFPMAAVVLALCLSVWPGGMPLVFIAVHVITFFLAAMLGHGELVCHRPAPEHLTAFYLAMSCGGVIGGLFNALVAPVVFDRVAEYPLTLVLACLALPKAQSDSNSAWRRILDAARPTTLGAVAWAMITFLQPHPETPQDDLGITIVIGLAVFGCYAFKDRPVRLALGLGAVMLAGGTYTSNFGRVLYQHRNYFGVLRVTHVASGNYHRLIYGQTIQGQQSLDPALRHEPLTYYHRTGPIGQIFSVLHSRTARPNVAIAGLGAGTLACYAEPSERWTFYEIDPAVERIACNPNYFTFLAECRAASTEVILGDARLLLKEAPEHAYGLIVMDAFNPDAIPTHLLTREALQLYLGKLAVGGIIAFHISNKFVDLVPVLGALARDANLTCLIRRDLSVSPEDIRGGKSTSMWGVMATRETDVGALLEDPRWESPPIRPSESLWTDDFTNVSEHLIGRPIVPCGEEN
jgi:spermidine synthase